MDKKIVLASSSPRRQELLRQVQLPYTIRTNEVNESLVTANKPKERVKQLAKLKNEATPLEHHNELIISADTIVAHKNKIFEKPRNEQDAFTMIATLSGDFHDVFTSVMIRSKEKQTLFVEQTKVEFWPLSKEEIEQYVKTDEPYDKAGAYGIQSLGAMFVKQIIGDYYNVVGLPISKVIRKLKKFEQ